MSTSIIISTYSINQLPLVETCLSSLKKQTKIPDEIILALDSNKEVLEFYRAKFPDIKVIDSGGFGLSKARNAGVLSSNSEIVVFIDDDAYAEENWLEEIVKEFDQPEKVGVGGPIIPYWEKNRPDWFPEELDWVVGCTYKGQPNEKKVIRNPIGCNMAFKKEIFSEVGYFKEGIGRVGNKLLGSEETEFSIRVYNKLPNVKIVYTPNATVHHRVSKKRSKLNYLINRTYYEGVSKALLSNVKINTDSFKTENAYFIYIFKTAIPEKLRRFYKLKNIKQILVLLLAVSSVGTGYLRGKFIKAPN
jgi:GT2 family glycosyltransferase